jgi:hypothetical protein
MQYMSTLSSTKVGVGCTASALFCIMAAASSSQPEGEAVTVSDLFVEFQFPGAS